MMRFRLPLVFLLLTFLPFLVATASAQQLPPVEPPKPMPGAQTEAPNLRVTTTEVLVPTLVEKRGGGISTV